MSGVDITKSSKSPNTQIIKQGHTTNDSFGSSPTRKVKGRTTRDISTPTAK